MCLTVQEMLECRDKLRCDQPHNYTYHDRIFANRMNHLIQLTDHSYQATMYREALKTGFYDLQVSTNCNPQIVLGSVES